MATKSKATEILKHLKKHKRKCSIGLDTIPTFYRKDTAYIITKPLPHIINSSMKTGIIPDDLKLTRVTLTFKSGAHDNFENCFLITVLPAISKVFEKYVHNQIMSHLEANRLLSNFQLSFRRQRSTEFATAHFTYQVRKATDEGQLIGAIYIDFSKAFDTIRHAVIIDKLQHFGIKSIPQQWIYNYLSGRQQRL